MTRKSLTIVEFQGDGIAGELSEAVHRIAAALPIACEFEPVDLTLERRRRDSEGAFREAEEAIHRTGLAMKYPTVTEAMSPNKVLRERLKFSVIHRPVRSIPGVKSRHDGEVDLHVVRVAVGGTYEDAGRHVGSDAAVSIRVIERGPCRHAAAFAFRLGERLKTHVISSSKYTIQSATDGLFEDVVKEVARKYPSVPHRKELFDSLLAKLIMNPEGYSVIVCPNEYGDFLSDAACGIVGSIGLGASASYSFSPREEITLAMFDPAGGTAPDIAGKGICNPFAALLAFGMLLEYAGELALGEALYWSVRRTIGQGEATRDIGGSMNTLQFTDAVCRTLTERLSRL